MRKQQRSRTTAYELAWAPPKRDCQALLSRRPQPGRTTDERSQPCVVSFPSGVPGNIFCVWSFATEEEGQLLIETIVALPVSTGIFEVLLSQFLSQSTVTKKNVLVNPDRVSTYEDVNL